MNRFTMAILTLLTLGTVDSACEECGHDTTCAAQKAAAEPAKPTESAKPVETAQQKKYREVAEAVWAKLMANASIVPGENWPENLDTMVGFSVVETVETSSGPTKFNAVANRLWDDKVGKPLMKNGKFVLQVRITYGYIGLCESDEHAVALVLGHELGHHALNHLTDDGR